MTHVARFVGASVAAVLGCIIGYHGAVAHSTALAGLGVATLFGGFALALTTDIKSMLDAVTPSVLQIIRAVRGGGAS